MNEDTIRKEVTEELRKEFERPAEPFEIRAVHFRGDKGYDGCYVRTSNQYYGWVAHLDNYDGPPAPISMGRTEREAVENLADRMDWNEDFYGMQACERWLTIDKGVVTE